MSNIKSICNEHQCTTARKKYFLGANSAYGYRSETDEFNEITLNRLYIIKGGPGTGKSTFMKHCADRAELSGIECTYYYCGSDPSSLDGIIIRGGDSSVGIIDGTSPHTKDCIYPGAVSRIIDFGECWDNDILCENKTQIIELSDEKSKLFNSAYRYLSGAASLKCDIANMAKLAIDYYKMNSAIERIIKHFNVEGSESVRCISGITMKGRITLDTFSEYENQYLISDAYGFGLVFTENLAASLNRAGIEHISLREPINGNITAVAVPQARVFFSISDNKYESQRPSNVSFTSYINMHRFIYKSEASLCRGQRRFAEKCYEALTDGALENLAKASAVHYAIEDIYVSAMDFSKLNKKCERTAEEIFSMF